MPVRDVFKGTFNKIIKNIYKVAKGVFPVSSDVIDVQPDNLSTTIKSRDELLRQGFPSDLKPSDRIVYAEFQTFKSKFELNKSANRYIDKNTGRFMSKGDFVKGLQDHRYQIAYNVSKIRRKDLTEQERRDLINKFRDKSYELTQGKRDKLHKNLLNSLSNELDDMRHEIGLISP